jgi:hypothetical protein
VYIPDYVSLIYPLVLDGKSVYEQGGTLAGLHVGINLRQKKVSDMYELVLGGYEASEYELETDFDKILKIALEGGFGPWGRRYIDPAMIAPPNGGIRAEELNVGTPEFAVVKNYSYKDNTNQLLYVPALIFPIEYPSGTPVYSYMQNIVVPLVKEILDAPTTEPPFHILK